ncbi:acyl-CoA synthetase [Microbacterium sp. ARD32]|uniref:acyl-CoA synthetase n=1 Tax=Microbacterium sp. ARD32 TaxID=2962577 RepID=UPI002880EAFB|nr:acyl-CoA synthetase [Microbacterium sp. ARD32]MDT0157879.1 acyl-CoA synthetase [Microbacterium sp. ARD32]
MPAAPRTFTARHVQLTRAALAAVAAVMITFSPDHSAFIGLSVFGGFAITTGLVLVLAAILVHPAGQRWPAILMGAASLVLGMVGSVPGIRSDGLFFAVVIAWAAVTGLVELIAGVRTRGTAGARDAILIGGLGLLLALLLALVPAGFVQESVTAEGATSTLTSIIIGVGLFGGYAAIVAVFLAIAGLTPAAKTTTDAGGRDATSSLADHGGHA